MSFKLTLQHEMLSEYVCGSQAVVRLRVELDTSSGQR